MKSKLALIEFYFQKCKMKAPLFGVAVAAALTFQNVTMASASPITYTLSGVTAIFGTQGTDSFSGSFTFNPDTAQLSSVAISVTGPVDPGSYSHQFTSPTASSITPFDGVGIEFTIRFLNNLGTSSDSVSSIQFIQEGSPSAASTSVTGQAVPNVSSVPGPIVGAGLPGLLAGLGAAFGWHRRRKLPRALTS